MSRTAAHLGLWAGILCAFLAVAFTALMVLDVMGLFHGTLQLVPVLLLAPCFITLVCCIHACAAAEKKFWALLALGFSGPYVVIVSFNYLIQMTVVHQNPAMYPWLVMSFRPDSMFGSLELLGYGWQAFALLALIPLFRGRAGDGVVRAIFLVNFILAMVGTVFYITTGNPMHLSVILSLGFWCVGFPIAMVIVGGRLWGSCPRVATG